MSSFLPSLKWPTLGFESRGSPPEDAPPSSLPPAERLALDTLITLATPLITSPPHALPRSDPWTKLSVDVGLRDRVLLRLLRFNSLSPARTLRQLRAILEWRATARIAEEPHDAMRGMAAGIPTTLLPPVGKGGARLFFAPAEKYEKKGVQRAAQEVGVARMFEYMLYDVDGPQAERCAVVVDFTGFSAKNMDLAGIKTGVYTYINYYPDVFHAILLVNYPKFLYGGKSGAYARQASGARMCAHQELV